MLRWIVVGERRQTLRVPESRVQNRRVENRVPGADANSYLRSPPACGYLGMTEKLRPTPPLQRNAYERRFGLPRYLPEAMAKLKANRPLDEVLGDDFVSLLLEVKQEEHDGYQQVISAWEREHLLLNV